MLMVLLNDEEEGRGTQHVALALLRKQMVAYILACVTLLFAVMVRR